MKINFRILFILFLISNSNAFAQLDSAVVIPKLKQHISTLASDAFEGRETGKKGEKLSYEYIIKQFQEIGLKPMGDEGKYLQPFPFTQKTFIGSATHLIVSKDSILTSDDFFPMAYSANKKVSGNLIAVGYGINAPKLNYNDYQTISHTEGKIFLMEISTPDQGGPHSKYDAYSDVRMRIDSAIAHGAAGIIFINSDSHYDNPKAEYINRITPSTIPVAFAGKKVADLLLAKKENTIELEIQLSKEEATGHNVIGFIDNGAATTVVIGAHYDHLGFGGEGSLYRGEPAIHNGADDNASGTAALIEIARYLKAHPSKGNNYLIMSYSGEEKGLLGSGYWVKHPTYPMEKINYMLNMDMVGRLKTEEPTLLINGVGTSDAWKITMNYVHVDNLKTKTTESGVGPSDHTSFYLKNIPVLHFFSGSHSDYHKPSDDENLINYPGELSIMNYMVQLITRLDDKGKLNFIKTKDDTNEDAPRFKVTLGVVPDYAFDGSGMRIDGITEGRPAAKAGLKAGDIVILMGDNKVLDMMSYMKALGKFNKGDKTDVTVKRGKEEVKVQVEF